MARTLFHGPKGVRAIEVCISNDSRVKRRCRYHGIPFFPLARFVDPLPYECLLLKVTDINKRTKTESPQRFVSIYNLTGYMQVSVRQTDEIFPENRIYHTMQIVSLGDQLHEISNPIFWEK